jgi:type III pantothenate kinase
MFKRYFNIAPLVVGPGIKTGFRIRMDNPREVGRDLISNAAGAISLYEKPIIIVAMGTAMAFTTISRGGDYIGGALAPGLGIAAEAL